LLYPNEIRLVVMTIMFQSVSRWLRIFRGALIKEVMILRLLEAYT